MLTAILGFVDLILWDSAPSDPRRADLEQVHYAATRAATITGQLLAFGRRQVLRPELIDLNAALRPLEPVLRHVLGEDKVLETEYARGLPPVLVDPGQIEQVILNLVLNARDALHAGGHVRIRTRSDLVPQGSASTLRGARFVGRAVVLSVEDDGRGMDEETRARAFEPFFTTKPVGQGTGLGLPTVLGIVQQSGAAIRLTTGPDQGTRFEIFFPEAAGEASVPAERATEHETAQRELVLVVEDEDLVRNVTCRYLVAAGYRCLEAADGVAALELYRRSPEPVAMVLTDLIMPRMGGRDLAEAIARTGSDVPVLYLTGYAQEEALRRGVVPPGGAILQKPFTPTELIARVRAMLDG
jgi:CheY-like chemotaxis protein